MEEPTRPPRNWFEKAARPVYHAIGFSKGYNAVLWFIFDGALLGFILARLQYFSYNDVFCSPYIRPASGAAPGECYQYSLATYRRVGIQLHLYGILPAGFLAVLQFIPVIRHRFRIVHRICGYLAILLAIVGTVGGLMVARFSFGGGIEIQTFVGLLAILFLGSLAVAYYNIKMLQIEQHRAWMLRAWFYAASIITNRLIMLTTAAIISLPGMGPYYKALECSEIFALNESADLVIEQYPTCADANAYALVLAQATTPQGPEQIAAAYDLTFGMALWLALALHAIGVEIYLRLTPIEFERLRKISYQRQMERGFKHAGSAGLTIDRYGDSEKWTPPEYKAPETESS